MSTDNLVEVKAAIAGVFYRKPSPESEPYVEVGHTVKEKQVLGLLETMKVFQKIKAPVEGKVVEIKAESEQAVSLGDVLFVISQS
jgi:biotin carboxyl carrier protein